LTLLLIEKQEDNAGILLLTLAACICYNNSYHLWLYLLAGAVRFVYFWQLKNDSFVLSHERCVQEVGKNGYCGNFTNLADNPLPYRIAQVVISVYPHSPHEICKAVISQGKSAVS